MKRALGRLRDVSRQLTSGFTLVELMVALTGGLFVSIAVFMLAKQATGLYQSEARMSNATLGSVVGFERLRLDIERASFLVSPNVRKDPRVCGLPDATWPSGLSHLAGVFIQPTDTSMMPVQTGNHIVPDEIVLAGSYASPDQFPTKSISNSGAAQVVVLESPSEPLARLGYQNVATAAEQRALLLTVFGVGRALRILDTEGHEQYGTITDVQGGSDPTILLASASPAILYRGTNTTLKCGIMSTGNEGHEVNVVNFIKYSIKDMASDTRYAPLFSAGVGGYGAIPPTDVGRTEFVREELDTSGNSITGSAEIVAEFAVDLSFGITVAELGTAAAGSQIEQLETFAPGAATTAWAGNTTTMDATRGPQRIRGVRARLSVRSREADRLSGMPEGGVIGPGLFRIGLGANGKAPFARVRTVQADIALRNQRGVKWL